MVFGDGTFYKTGDDATYEIAVEGGDWHGPIQQPGEASSVSDLDALPG